MQIPHSLLWTPLYLWAPMSLLLTLTNRLTATMTLPSPWHQLVRGPTHTHAHTHACTHACTHARTHACTHAHTHTHTHTPMYATHTHTHTHTQTTCIVFSDRVSAFKSIPLTAGGHDELVELLLAQGSNIEHRDKKGTCTCISCNYYTHRCTYMILCMYVYYYRVS